MKIHITNLYNFNSNDTLAAKQHRFANAGRELGFTEMGIFSYPVETDTKRELSKRLDGIIAALEPEDVVFMQLPTGNGFTFEHMLFNKIKTYPNTKIILAIHDIQLLSDTTDPDLSDSYLAMCKQADAVIIPSAVSSGALNSRGLTRLLYCDDIQLAEHISSADSAKLQNTADLSDSCGFVSLCQSDFYLKKILMDALELAFSTSRNSALAAFSATGDEIQIAFALHDKTGNYCMWVGVTMQSILEHTSSKICFHILHDNTLTQENKDKLLQIVRSSRHRIIFHYLDSTLFSDTIDQVKHFTIGTMFRIMLPELLPELSKIIYLDADLLINRDINELWQTDIKNYALAAVPDMGVTNKFVYPFPVKQGQVQTQNYFNAGVLFFNLDYIRNTSHMRNDILHYLQITPEASFPDQDALNVIYGEHTLLLDSSWNYFATHVRLHNEMQLARKIYHYAGTKLKLTSLTEMDLLYFETIRRTPWGAEECRKHLNHSLSRMLERISLLEKILHLTGKNKNKPKRIFYGKETFAMKNLYNLISIHDGDYRILHEQDTENDCILPCKEFSTLSNEAKGTFIVFVLPEADNWTSIAKLEQLGLIKEKDFFVIPCILPPEQGGYV